MAQRNDIAEAGKRLAGHMRAIREAHGVSPEAVIRATKAAPNVVEEFERTALVTNAMYNRVYLRLFVRSYAEVIRVRSDDALRAVDEVLAGHYTDRLSRLYLDEPGGTAEADDEAEAEGEAAAVPESALDPEPADETVMPEADLRPSGSGETAVADEVPPVPPVPPTAELPATVPPPRPRTAIPKPGTVIGKKGPAVLLPGNQNLLRIAGSVAGILIVAVVAWLLWPEGSPDPDPIPVPPDTVATRLPVLPPRIVLGDTTTVMVIAARDTLNPIRVTAAAAFLDDRWYALSQPRTPVWVEFQDTLLVKATESLILEQHADDVDLWVRGLPLPTGPVDARGRLEVTRDQIQAHLDSLRAAGSLPGA